MTIIILETKKDDLRLYVREFFIPVRLSLTSLGMMNTSRSSFEKVVEAEVQEAKRELLSFLYEESN